MNKQPMTHEERFTNLRGKFVEAATAKIEERKRIAALRWEFAKIIAAAVEKVKHHQKVTSKLEKEIKLINPNLAVHCECNLTVWGDGLPYDDQVSIYEAKLRGWDYILIELKKFDSAKELEQLNNLINNLPALYDVHVKIVRLQKELGTPGVYLVRDLFPSEYVLEQEEQLNKKTAESFLK